MAVSIVEYDWPHKPTKYYEVSIDDHLVRTTVTRSSNSAACWIQNHFQNPSIGKAVVGLDVEWRPNPHRSRHGERNPVATIQICNGNCCLIFQVLRSCCIPKPLYTLLKNPKISFAGVQIGGDAEKLVEDYDLEISTTLDVGRLAAKVFGDKNLKSEGLKTLASVVSGIKIRKPKRVTLSNWDAKNLKSDQVMYACADAYVSYKIARRLTKIRARDM